MEEEIDGAFIKGYKIHKNTITDDYFWIKLSEIKVIRPLDGEDACVFALYKDQHFYCKINHLALKIMINIFIFEPHLLTYWDPTREF